MVEQVRYHVGGRLDGIVDATLTHGRGLTDCSPDGDQAYRPVLDSLLVARVHAEVLRFALLSDEDAATIYNKRFPA